MSQANQITRERRTLVGRETTFGTTPSGSFPEAMTEIVLMHDEMLVDGIATEMLDVMDARARRQDAIAPVAGLQIASKYPAKSYLKVIPTSAILTAAGSVASLSHRILFGHLLGAEHAALGTTVASGASATVFDVADATNLKKGTWILVDGEPTLITNIATSTITVSPALSGTPSNGDIVRNGYNYAPAESHSSSLTFQTAFAGVSAAQFVHNGCYGAFKINLPIGQLATIDLDFTASSYTQPANQSINNWIDSTAFAFPAQYTFGNAGRNIMTGPGFLSTDLSLQRNFGLKLNERSRIEFRAEAFNLMNTPQFGNPNATLGNPAFGTIGGTARSNRQMQLGLRFLF